MFVIDIDSSAIDNAFNQLIQSIDDMTPIMREIGEHITSEIDLLFRDAKDPYGQSWDPLTELTISRRTRGSSKPLNDTGALKASITSNPDRHSVKIGTNEIYAITHQLGAEQGQYGKNRRGSPIPWGDIPARAFLPTSEQGLPDAWENDILTIISQHLDNSI